MAKIGGTKGWLVVAGVAVLLTLAVLPAATGAASASPVAASTADPASNQWAYGGTGYSNGTLTIGNDTLTWNSMFGWTAIFTATNTSATTVQLEEQRTVGITVDATFTSPLENAKYSYHAQETDVAFANLTNASTVYVNGSPVPALGLTNDSTSIAGLISESISVTRAGVTRDASLDVTGTAHASVQFDPSLGLIPLNLSGVNEWNSSSSISAQGGWNITYSWANNGFGGVTGSGTGYSNGTLNRTGNVSLTGYVTAISTVPHFIDHTPRVGVVLIVQGPLGNYDAFVLVPRGFDLFGGGAHAYDSDSLGAATISSQTLYVSQGPRGPTPTAAATSFGASATAVGGLSSGTPVEASPAANTPTPSSTVVGNPMSVSQAQAENQCLTGGCSATVPAGVLGAAALVAVIALAVVAVVGTVAVVEWRSYARRRSQKGLVGGYGESWPNGVPPAAAGSNVTPPTGPTAGSPPAPQEPQRPF
jgi:hypothetical protein